MVRFDPVLEAWVLSRHADVLAALRDPRLQPGEAGGAIDETAHRQLRESGRSMHSPERVAEWERWTGEAFASWPARRGDLIAGLAAPLGLRIAAQVAGLADDEAARLAPLARQLFGSQENPAAATLTLAAACGDALRVQAFAALCHTLPAFLGNAWLALLEHPEELARLQADPALLTDAIEELLRYAGPSAAVFRRAATAVEYGGERIERGAKVMLRLADANRDAEAFPDPDRLRLDRRPAGHLAFGSGAHACVGAPLIRLAARPAMSLFAGRFAGRTMEFHAEPEPGVTMRSLRSLVISY